MQQHGAQQIHRLRFCFLDFVDFQKRELLVMRDVYDKQKMYWYFRCRPLQTTKMDSFATIVQLLTIISRLSILVRSN